MTKAELVEALQEMTGVSKKKTAEILDSVFTNVQGAITRDGGFSYPGFGTFKVTERKARKGRNPKTGAPLDIPASKTVKFKPATAFKTTL